MKQKNTKKILYLTHASLKDPMRGTPIRMRHIAKQLNRGHNLIVCATEIDQNDDFEFVEYPQKLRGMQKLLFFVRLVKKQKIDIVITSTETNIKLPILIKFFTGVKIVLDLHGIHVEELVYAKKISRFYALMYSSLICVCLPFYNLVLPVSEKLGNYYGRWIRRFKVIYGGVDLCEFKVHSTSNTDKEMIIGYMGNARPYQGLKELLGSIEILRSKGYQSIKVNLVLSGITDTELSSLLDCYKLRNVTTFVLNAPHADVSKYIKTSSVLVIPRLMLPMTEYAYPSKLPEYLALRIPVIVTNVGPIDEIFRLNKNCSPMIVISPINIISNLANAIESFMHMSSVEKIALTSCAMRLVESSLAWDVIGDEMNDMLAKLK